MATDVTITSVEFRNFKALKYYSLKLNNMNILVGPNNSGKSTIISAFRVLEVGIRHANNKKPTLVPSPTGERFGYSLSPEIIPMALENVHTDYEDVDTTVTFRLSNNNKLILFFPIGGGCYLLTETTGKQVTSPNLFKTNFPIKICIVPVLGPIEQNETILSKDTVRSGLTTHRASRHFRNFWWYYPDGFDEFANMVSRTWPGMELEPPKRADAMSNELVMFCYENRMPRELYWSGFGFQIWCQLLTHIYRCNDATLLIIDEPEVYLHPDVQRQLLGILRYSGPDIILATHSTEILSEADASDILLINKQKRSAERLRDLEGVQKALDTIGSIQNITLTHLARSGRILFVEGMNDFKLLRRFSRILGLVELSSGNDITVIESGGFSYWENIKSFAWGFKTSFNSDIHVGAIFDRDYWCNEQLNEIQAELRTYLDLAHIHHRKEIENYLLVPKVLERVLNKSLRDRAKRTGTEIIEQENIFQILDRISLNLKSSSQAQYISKRLKYFGTSKIDSSTITETAIQEFESKWSNLETRMEIIPGKEALKNLRTEIQNIYSVNLTDTKIIDEFKINEIPEDLKELIYQLEKFRTS